MDEREGRSSRTRREAQKGATRGWGFGLLIIRIARGRRHGTVDINNMHELFVIDE